MNDTDKQMPIDLYEALVIKNLNGFIKSFRCWNKVNTCIHSLQIDFVGVLGIAK